MAKERRQDGGRFHRFMFSIMGPAQVGPYDDEPARRSVSACAKCGTPWDEHEVVRTESRAYSRCPQG
jgi:hypothetical protein